MSYPFYPENYEHPPMSPDEWEQKMDVLFLKLDRAVMDIEGWSDLEDLRSDDLIAITKMRTAIANARLAVDGIEQLLTDDVVRP